MNDKAIQIISEVFDVKYTHIAADDAERTERILDTLRAAGIVLVQLPEPDETDDDGQTWFGDYSIRVDTTGRPEHWNIYLDGKPVDPHLARHHAIAIIAAVDEYLTAVETPAGTR